MHSHAHTEVHTVHAAVNKQTNKLLRFSIKFVLRHDEQFVHGPAVTTAPPGHQTHHWTRPSISQTAHHKIKIKRYPAMATIRESQRRTGAQPSRPKLGINV